MPLTCVAIDDEPLALAVISSYVAKFPVLKMLSTFDDAISGAEFIRRHPADILFMDINMPDINGIDLVRSLEKKPIIIFTTAHKQFAHEGFELEALDYLLKPIDFTRFSRTVNKALEFHQYKTSVKKDEQEFIFVRSEYKQVKISLAEMDFAESLEDYCRINLLNGEHVLTLMSLKSLLEKLPQNQFKRIHRSYVVPVSGVVSVVNRKVKLSSGKELPVGESYAEDVQQWMKNL